MHIAEMRARVSRCFERFGRPVRPGTWKVHSERFNLNGHIDFVGEDTIWGLEVSGTAPVPSTSFNCCSIGSYSATSRTTIWKSLLSGNTRAWTPYGGSQ